MRKLAVALVVASLALLGAAGRLYFGLGTLDSPRTTWFALH
jgi:hypothetical protein